MTSPTGGAASSVGNAAAVPADDDKAIADARNEANNYSIEERDLRSVASFDDAMGLLDNFHGAESYDNYGNGFEILDNKNRLVDNPFVVLEWRFNKSKQFAQEFVSMLVVTKSGEKLIVNDGSTGIAAQMRMVTDERIRTGARSPQTGLLVSRGLRRSDYKFTDGDGAEKDATTYYLG